MVIYSYYFYFLVLFPGQSSKRSGAAKIAIYVIFDTSSQEKQSLEH